ncbi:MAG: threonine synthase [Rhodothermales bacterium]|jgi:threonine synthase
MTEFVQRLGCTHCETHFLASDLHTVCPHDGRPLEIRYDLERLASARPGLSWMQPELDSMWRYGLLLPVAAPPGFPSAGWTPLERHSGSEVELYIKEEGARRAGWGWNATASFKDRGIGMAVAMAREFSLRTLSIPTQGNAGDSLVTFARAMGIGVYVAMPQSTPHPILDRVRALAETDPDLHLILAEGTIREAGAMLRKHLEGKEAFSVATFAEPGWRIEGKKTMGLEIAEQLGWRLPDAIVYPTGGGTGILGIWKAFQELKALGCVTGPLPKMISIQSAETTPLVDAMVSGAADSTPAEAGTTIATGLNVPYGIGHQRVLEIIRESGGDAIGVSESAIRAEMDSNPELCPEGAACIAAIDECRDRGLIGAGDTVVVLNTGSPAKYA